MKKEKLLKQISDLREIQATLEPNCREFCKDKSIPIEDRWEVFEEAPNKGKDSWYSWPCENELGFEISPDDDWYMERKQTFDVVGELNTWEQELENSKEGDKENKYANRRVIDIFKEYYMQKYLAFWEWDW